MKAHEVYEQMAAHLPEVEYGSVEYRVMDTGKAQLARQLERLFNDEKMIHEGREVAHLFSACA